MPDIAICVVHFSFYISRYRSHLGNEKEKNAFNANEEKNANEKKIRMEEDKHVPTLRTALNSKIHCNWKKNVAYMAKNGANKLILKK